MAMATPVCRDAPASPDLFPGDPNPKSVGYYTFDYELGDPDVMVRMRVSIERSPLFSYLEPGTDDAFAAHTHLPNCLTHITP